MQPGSYGAMDASTEKDMQETRLRPAGMDDTTVEALGELSKALETVHRVRGHLYSAHQLVGGADLTLDRVVKLLREAGHDETADRVEHELLGRNLLPGR